jgi:deoxyribonucleoside regulator
MIIALGQGTTMRAVVTSLKGMDIEPHSLTVVPLIGGLTKASPETHTNFLAREMAAALGGTHLEMYAPTLADSAYNRNVFVSDSSVLYVLTKARAADIILTGIGEVSASSRLISLCSFSNADIEKLNAVGAVGEIGSNFYNSEGKTCAMEFNYRVVGLTFEEIARAPLVIGVAGGDRKLEAVHGMLKSNLLDVLITDDVIARTIREREQKT